MFYLEIHFYYIAERYKLIRFSKNISCTGIYYKFKKHEKQHKMHMTMIYIVFYAPHISVF